MLILLFYIGDVLYSINCEKIREIVPVVKLKKVPQSPDFFAGYFNFRGIIAPVVDLCRLIQNRDCQPRLSTRIILVDYQFETETRILGLMAERITDIIKKPEKALIMPDIRSKEAPYLGGIIMQEEEMIQYIDLTKLPACVDFMPIPNNTVPVKRD